jgi:membrane-bound serine protease (ClpP class)
VCPASTLRRPRFGHIVSAALALSCFVLAFVLANGGAAGAGAPAEAADASPVPVGHIEGVVNLGTARYVDRVIQAAEQRGAPAAVLTLDAGAGYEGATQRVVDRIEQSAVPVIVFVAPSGARATDAGLFVLQAADVAAMAQGTSVGATGNVAAPGSAPPPAVATAAALGGGLAQTRERDGRWVRGAVLDGAALPATEALRQGVVDEVASDVPDLLSKTDGRRVTGPWGTRALATRGLTTEQIEPGWAERVLDQLVDPNVAYLLLVLGLYGIVTELAAPGVTVPGVAGGIALLLALLIFAQLPVNWVGVALLAAAAGLFLAEMQVVSHGLFTLSGLAAFVVGSVLLFRPPGGVTSPYGGPAALNPWLIVVLGLGTAVGFGWLLRQGIVALRQPHANAPPRAGEVGIAGPVVDTTGTVHLGGQTWSAEWPAGAVTPGQRVRVVGRRGLRLIVEPVDEGPGTGP